MAFASLVRVSGRYIMSRRLKRVLNVLIPILVSILPAALLVTVVCTPTLCEFVYQTALAAFSQTHKIIESFFAITTSIMKVFTIY